MSGRRLALLAVAAAAATMMVWSTSAWSAGGSRVLRFHNGPSQAVGVGFNVNSNTAPPIGASLVITAVLYNVGSQFGKPSGARVGRVLLDCTFLTLAGGGDGLCSGIGHVPDGYFTFGGNGAFVNAKVNHYAITGGVGPYASERGQIKVTNLANGGSNAVVTLTP